MSINNNYIKIKIQGTTSNFGSGYDILGMSLGIWNEIKLKKTDITKVKITGIYRWYTIWNTYAF